MFRIREVKLSDLDALWELICQATAGLTSLQIDKPTLLDRLEQSVFAFSRTAEKPEGAPYVLVLEDRPSGALVGTSCIFSKTGGYQPQYSYRKEAERASSEVLGLEMLVHSLHLHVVHDGPTEIGSLFLLPEFRGKGAGKLLSLSRFLYMAIHPKRFALETIAEMRGFQDSEGHSPFWDAIGAHFMRIDFPRADSLSMVDKSFIADLMPKYPIYLELLPSTAVECIGKVHDQTKPALAMLEAQGFHRNNLIDIFDGGPVVSCPTLEIKAVEQTKTARWIEDSSVDRKLKAIVARRQSPFMAVECSISVTMDARGELAVLGDAIVQELELQPGQEVTYLILKDRA